MARTIEVLPHDQGWDTSFVQESRALEQVFASTLVAIHHIGSTSVRDLAAKPIIDILIVLHETDTIARFSHPMEALGYRVRGECLDAEVPGTPGRFYFSKNRGETRTHQVHVCAVGHSEIADKLAFRDYLRAHPRRAAEYGALKQRLALRHRQDSLGYMHGKDDFIRTVLQEAREWSGATNDQRLTTNDQRPTTNDQ